MPDRLLSFIDYAELVDWSGRTFRAGKRGAIDANTAPVLVRLDISTDQWLNGATGFEAHHHFKSAVASKKK